MAKSRVGKLGEHQYLGFGVGLVHQAAQRQQLLVVCRVPLALQAQQFSQRLGVLRQVLGQRRLEQAGANPLEALFVLAGVLFVNSLDAGHVVDASIGFCVATQPVAEHMQRVDLIHRRRGIEPGIAVSRVGFIHRELQGHWPAIRKVAFFAVFSRDGQPRRLR